MGNAHHLVLKIDGIREGEVMVWRAGRTAEGGLNCTVLRSKFSRSLSLVTRFAKNVVGSSVARSRTPDGCFQHLVGHFAYHGIKGYIRD